MNYSQKAVDASGGIYVFHHHIGRTGPNRRAAAGAALSPPWNDCGLVGGLLFRLRRSPPPNSIRQFLLRALQFVFRREQPSRKCLVLSFLKALAGFQ